MRMKVGLFDLFFDLNDFVSIKTISRTHHVYCNIKFVIQKVVSLLF